jgi:hypothetical protein
VNFKKQSALFRTFLGTVPFARFARPDRGDVAIIVTPWAQTAVPWYSIAMALLYRERGWNATLVWDDLPSPSPRDLPTDLKIIESALDSLDGKLPVIPLSTVAPVELDAEDQAEIVRLTNLNMISYLKAVPDPRPEPEIEAHCLATLDQALQRIRGLLVTNRYDHLLIPGGIYGKSGLYLHAGRRNGVRVACFDSGAGSMTIGVDNVAGYCMDLAKMFLDPRFTDFVHANKDRALELGRKEFELRTQGRDRYTYQSHAYREHDDLEGGDVLIPMSVFDDAAGLGRNLLFPLPEDWLRETIEFLLRETNATVVVREHPNAWRMKRGTHLRGFLESGFVNEPRFRFVGGDQKISTYNLLEKAQVVLPCASTVGVEAAALGKAVIVESSVYYGNLSFVQKAVSKTDYFERIRNSLANPEPLADEQREQAWLCYFFGQVANFVDCDFTPQPVDFNQWAQRPFAELSQDPKVRLIVDAFSLGIPSCRLQSELILTKHPGSFQRKRLWRKLCEGVSSLTNFCRSN